MAKGRTMLFNRTQPGGVFVIDDMKEHPGDIFFVDSGHAAASDTAGFGQDPDSPFATIDYAIGQCTASQGDTIYVMPGHAETISGAAGIAADVIGISIIGLGNGSLRPTVTFDTGTDAQMTISAANIVVDNVIFSANFADIVAAISVTGDDVTIKECRFQATATNMNFLICIDDGGANTCDRLTVEDNYFLAIDASNTHAVSFGAAQDGCIIRNNIFIGDWGTMCIGGAGVVTFITIVDNVIYNAGNTNDSIINLDATATGIVMRNLACGAAAQANGITATACAVAENYYGVISEDLSAILDPIAT